MTVEERMPMSKRIHIKCLHTFWKRTLVKWRQTTLELFTNASMASMVSSLKMKEIVTNIKSFSNCRLNIKERKKSRTVKNIRNWSVITAKKKLGEISNMPSYKIASTQTWIRRNLVYSQINCLSTISPSNSISQLRPSNLRFSMKSIMNMKSSSSSSWSQTRNSNLMLKTRMGLIFSKKLLTMIKKNIKSIITSIQFTSQHSWTSRSSEETACWNGLK